MRMTVCTRQSFLPPGDEASIVPDHYSQSEWAGLQTSSYTQPLELLLIVGLGDKFCHDYCLQLELHALSYALLVELTAYTKL